MGLFFRYFKTFRLDIDYPVVGGFVTKSPDKDRYNRGEVVSLMAVPHPSYGFHRWSEALFGSNNPVTLVMDADKSVTTRFVALKVETNSIGMMLVYIPPGSFMMGSPQNEEGRKENEGPQHQVTISKGFWMGQTEVTQGQYESVMNARPWSGKESVVEGADNPAVYVSRNDASDFCKKLSQKEGKTYRLPTKAEWEYACRAGTTTWFSLGDSGLSLGDYAWFGRNTADVKMFGQRVGQKKSNPWGLYDMHGNVWEWCSDLYDANSYGGSPDVDPPEPSSRKGETETRCLRDGSWRNGDEALRYSYRHGGDPTGGSNDVGFRVVREK